MHQGIAADSQQNKGHIHLPATGLRVRVGQLELSPVICGLRTKHKNRDWRGMPIGSR